MGVKIVHKIEFTPYNYPGESIKELGFLVKHMQKASIRHHWRIIVKTGEVSNHINPLKATMEDSITLFSLGKSLFLLHDKQKLSRHCLFRANITGAALPKLKITLSPSNFQGGKTTTPMSCLLKHPNQA